MAHRRAFRHSQYFNALAEIHGPKGFRSQLTSDGLDQVLYDPARIVCSPPCGADEGAAVNPKLLEAVESSALVTRGSPRRVGDRFERWVFELDVREPDPEKDERAPHDALSLARWLEGANGGQRQDDPSLDWRQQVAPVSYALTQQHTQPGEDPEGGSPVLGLSPGSGSADAGLGEGMKIAVIDTGVDQSGATTFGSRHLVDQRLDLDGLADPTDGSKLGPSAGHGTFIASLIHCVAPAAEVLSIRVADPLGLCDEEVIADGIRRAVRSGATIINLSFGGYPFAGSASDPDWPTLRAFGLLEAAIAEVPRDIAIVAAAGNCGSSAEFYPAAFPQVIGVAALDECGGRLWEHSNYGAWVAACAPGVNLRGLFVKGDENPRYDPDGMAEHWADGVNFATWSGTSFAAPLVAAQIAILAAEMGLGDTREAACHLLNMAKAHRGRIPCGKRILVDLPGQT